MSIVYNPKRILCTGSCGFIGAFFVRYLLETYNDIEIVVTYDKIIKCSKPHPFVCTSSQYKYYNKHVLVKGDICDQDLVLDTLNKYNIDTIVHLAALTHVDYSFHSSMEFTKTNVMGTHVILQCALDLKDQIKRLIIISTDEIYGTTSCNNNEPCTENSILNATNPYAATKVAAEALVKSYVTSFNLPCIITRGNNVIGPEQFPDKAFPKFICRLLRGLPIELHGSGLAQRSFLYVDDTVNAIDTIMRKGQVGQIYNIAADQEITMVDLANWIVNHIETEHPEIKLPSPRIKFVEDRAFNDQRYFISSQLLYDLGWKPTVTLEQGLVKTFKWYYENHQKLWFWEDQIDKSLAAHPHFDNI